jgi:hypothetical protein
LDEHSKYSNSAIDALNLDFDREMPLDFSNKKFWNIFFLGKGFMTNSTLYTEHNHFSRIEISNPYNSGENLIKKIEINGLPKTLGIVPLDSEAEKHILHQIRNKGYAGSENSSLDFHPNLYFSQELQLLDDSFTESIFRKDIQAHSFNSFAYKYFFYTLLKQFLF